MLNTNVWARHSVEKNVDFMQNMSCSLPSPEAIHAARFMQRIHAEYRHASCRLPIPSIIPLINPYVLTSSPRVDEAESVGYDFLQYA